MIEISVGKDLLGHFTPAPANEGFVSNMLDEASTPSLGRLASTIQLVRTASPFSLTPYLQFIALFL